MNLNLNYEGFENYLKETRELFGGIQYLFKFKNNYGASVVKHDGSYGNKEDLWELAVIRFDRYDKWCLNFDTEITDDVLGYLTDEDVRGYLKEISELN